MDTVKKAKLEFEQYAIGWCEEHLDKLDREEGKLLEKINVDCKCINVDMDDIAADLIDFMAEENEKTNINLEEDFYNG